MSPEEAKKKACQAIDLWNGTDYFQLMVELCTQLDVNLFEIHLQKMRMKTAARIKNKHTGEEGYISKIEKNSTISDYDGKRIDGDWYYEITIDARRKGLSGKSFWEHWDVLD